MNEDNKLLSEEGLIKALRTGENRAFKQVYRQGYSLVEAFILNNGGRKEDAKDLFQEVLFVLIKKLREPNFHLSCALNTFLYAIARNIWKTQNRDKKYYVALKDTQHNPIDLTEEDITLKKLFEKQHDVTRQLIDKLSDRCRQILLSFCYEKKSIRQIAGELNTTENSIKVQKHRCMTYLKNKMEAHPEYQNLIRDES